jgi:hypothetical protein
VITFQPHLDILPPSQRILWDELHQTPAHFTLYGGTALALRLGHRQSVDFDFFTHEPIEPRAVIETIPYLRGAQERSVAKNTLTCMVDLGAGRVKMQFFGGLTLGIVEPRQQAEGGGFWVASLIDIAACKMRVLPERAEQKDYLDIDALLKHGIELPTMLAAAKVVYGPAFNTLLPLKALSYFEDVQGLPNDAKKRLATAAAAVDLHKLPAIPPAPPQ